MVVEAEQAVDVAVQILLAQADLDQGEVRGGGGRTAQLPPRERPPASQHDGGGHQKRQPARKIFPKR